MGKEMELGRVVNSPYGTFATPIVRVLGGNFA